MLCPGSFDDYQQIFLPIFLEFFVMPADERMDFACVLCEADNIPPEPMVGWEFYGCINKKWDVLVFSRSEREFICCFCKRDWRSVSVRYPVHTSFEIVLYPLHKSLCVPGKKLNDIIQIRPDLAHKINFNRLYPSWPIKYTSANASYTSEQIAEMRLGCPGGTEHSETGLEGIVETEDQDLKEIYNTMPSEDVEEKRVKTIKMRQDEVAEMCKCQACIIC